MLQRRYLLRTIQDGHRFLAASRRLASTATKAAPRILASDVSPTAPADGQSLPSSSTRPVQPDPKPFPAPPPYKRRTPLWLLENPVFIKTIKSLAWLLGHNSKTTTAIRETRGMYQACAEREVKETGFIYVGSSNPRQIPDASRIDNAVTECRLAPTFQTWFSFTNLHIWLLSTRFRALPPSYGRLYIQELINHFFLDAEYRLRSVYGPKCPERIIKKQMVDLRDQWNGSTSSYDVAMVKSDAELAAALWRNIFAARGEKAYKEADLSEEEREERIEVRRRNNDPEADGAPLEEIPRLVYMYVAHVRRELQRLEALSDADVLAGKIGKFGRVGSINHPDTLLTNDGNAILREIDVAHPAAKNMIDLSRTQDEEVGDGTTSVIILAGEILAQSLPQLERNIHPVVIISALQKALKDALEIINKISVPIDTSNDKEMLALIKTSIGTKFVQRWSGLMCELALKAVRTVSQDDEGIKTVDIKRYARVEKVPGGEIEMSRVLDGVMLNKDVVHPAMSRKLVNPRIILLDCPLEYKKGESQTNIEISREEDYDKILRIEEEQIKLMVDKLLEFKPTLVFTEKGVSELATYHLQKAGVTAIRRVRKSDNNRIARAVGATIVNRVEDLRESDVGTKCGMFHIEKLGDEYFTFLTQCKSPKACTILLRGPSKDILNEIDRNLADAMSVARNVVFHPFLAPGGGATEMAISVGLAAKARTIEGVEGWPYRAVADAMEVQTLKTSIEAARMLLRVDDIVQAKRQDRQGGGEIPVAGEGDEMAGAMEP
ncbi:T-complex protein 1 subunit gamma [Tulasnella sp. 403]|nr:T-complex protein 1 subunit gamma [Tulasnella sp. 403]